MRMSTLDRSLQRGPLTKDVLLPNKLIQIPRAHPHSQGCVRSWDLITGGFAGVKQSVSH
jgi:hypothetical protein